MFTYQLSEPRRPFASALQATFIHASLIAGAIWTTTPVTTTVLPSHEVIDLSGIAPHRRPICDCATSTHQPLGQPIPLDIRLIPQVPPIKVPTGIQQVDARAFIIGDSTLLPTAFGGDTALSGAVLEEAMVDEIPTLLVAGQLRYPAVLDAARVEGSVTLSFVIDLEGRIESEGLSVVSATDPGFVPAAKEAVLTSRFRPAMKAHHPVRVRVQQTISFKH